MTHIAKFVIAFGAGVALYLVTFALIVHKPLTVGITKRYIDHKLSYLRAVAPQPKIAVFGGSNGRFSHRCEAIERAAGVPCVNLSIIAGLSLTWQFEKYRPYFNRGDVLYLPLEYSNEAITPPVVGTEAPYLMAYEFDALFELYEPRQLLHALFYFDIRYLFSGMAEMALAATGRERRFSTSTLTPQGDEKDHTDQKAAAYRTVVEALPAPTVPRTTFQTGERLGELRQILDWARSAGVVAVGGLPTTFDDVVVPAEATEAMRALYREQGHCLLVLPNLSLYPRSAFFDTAFHLTESMQIQHSVLLAPGLASIARSGCPSADP